PGDGLKSKESEYYGKGLDFRYWKAYNTVDKPTLIATGILYGQSYPDRFMITNWKKSIYSSWDYRVDNTTSILGDSAVILYYETGKLDSGEKKTITTSYINGEPVISTGDLGIGEIVTAENVEAVYCPGSTAIIKVDVISRKPGNEGQLDLEIRDEKDKVVYTKREYTGIMDNESLDVPFRWQTPGNITPTYFNVVATLYDINGKELGRKETRILVDNAACMAQKGEGLNWILLLIPLLLIFFGGVLFVVIQAYSRLGDVEITKEKEDERVKVAVWNKKKKEIKNCLIVDRITEGAEVDILTAGVERRDTKLMMYVGTLESGGKAILEYRIKDVEYLPPAVVRWDFGESVSR
ncbi:MAG: hypothetical protein JW778_08425, partial [Candidatus Altiarchaeota archaeon]|nr:hypothetical protein [Candidatus Altiarchaeota archaeon]